MTSTTGRGPLSGRQRSGTGLQNCRHATLRRPSWAASRPEALLALALLALALLGAGCGGDPEPTDDAGATPPRAEADGSAEAPAGEGSSLGADEPPPLGGGGGGERIVFIGDSLAVASPPTFADLLPGALGERAPGVEVVNLAEPGTTAADWRPGGELFDRSLAPELAGADVVAVTLGGNDLQEALGGSDGLDALSAGPEDAPAAGAALDRFARRLGAIFAAIRELAPGVRIAYVGYPDYSRASAWQAAAGTAGTLALRVGLASLQEAAADAEPDLSLDMRRATARAGVDSLLADSEHLGPAGHRLYARRLAAELTR